jgi:hypothetical protein
VGLSRRPHGRAGRDDQNSDWGDWARSDPELKALLKPDVLVQTVDGVEILKRSQRCTILNPPDRGELSAKCDPRGPAIAAGDQNRASGLLQGAQSR